MNATCAGGIPIVPPPVRGTLLRGKPLAPFTWFRVGGPADLFFMPEDEADLAAFLPAIPAGCPLTVIGVGSNILVRDGGVRGVVIRLPAGFARVAVEPGHRVRAGAAALDVAVAKAALDHSVSGLEFLRGIPGTIGGGLVMNAGAYGGEFKDVLIEARALDRTGKTRVFSNHDMGYRYRGSAVPEGLIFVEAVFQGRPGSHAEIEARMASITEARETAQPVRARTGGSTFKNPDLALSQGKRAWELIDAAGCRGLRVGDAQVSEKHCNFLINLGTARAADLEALGETVRERVAAATGVSLEWEIKRIGEAG
jgi:UDP-N-acetylmuramate dehydrogenase